MRLHRYFILVTIIVTLKLLLAATTTPINTTTTTTTMTTATMTTTTMTTTVEDDYITNQVINDVFQRMQQLKSEFVSHYVLGKSVRGKDIQALVVGPKTSRADVPQIAIVANIHGNEVFGRKLVFLLAKIYAEQTSNGSQSDRYQRLWRRIRAHFVPALNPDGFEEAERGRCKGEKGKFNANGVDLLNNFPDALDKTYEPRIEKETQVIMDWIKKEKISLLLNFAGNNPGVTYPFYNSLDGSARYSLTPDDDFFRFLASNLAFYFSEDFLRLSTFVDGTANGATVDYGEGNFMDWLYSSAGCMGITVGLSNCAISLNISSMYNLISLGRNTLIHFLSSGLEGVAGVVTSGRQGDEGRPLEGAQVTVKGRKFPSFTARDGCYWRHLLPGRYTLIVSYPGCDDVEKVVNVKQRTLFMSPPRTVDFRICTIKKSTQKPPAGSSASGVHASKLLCLDVYVLLFFFSREKW